MCFKTIGLPAKFVVLLVIILLSCAERSDPPNVAAPGDYYPISIGNKNTYLQENFNPKSSQIFSVDTIEIICNGETTIGDKVYKKLEYDIIRGAGVEYAPFREFRKDGSKYFWSSSSGSPLFFMDTEKPAGSQWNECDIDQYQDTKITYSVDAVNANRTINGIDYYTVIEISKRTYYITNDGTLELNSLERGYFAKGVGEIYYSYESYGYLFGVRRSLLSRI